MIMSKLPALLTSGHSRALMLHACDVIVLTPNIGISRLVCMARLSWHHVSTTVTAHLHGNLAAYEYHAC